MNRNFFKLIFLCCVLLFASVSIAKSQTLAEILLHFSEEEMKVPLTIRNQMIENKGNTMMDYNGFKLNIYDKRNCFLRITTPTEATYEIAVWKINHKEDLLVALCETHCGMSCQSTISFYLPSQNWAKDSTEKYIPELSVNDIFNEKKLEKNYLTPQNVIKDFQIKTQFLLPQTGHDIIVVFTCLDELDKTEYQRVHKFLDGVMLDLIWKNETFIKSNAYFSGN